MTHPHWVSQDQLVHAFPTPREGEFAFTLCKQYVIPSYKPAQVYAHMTVNCVFCIGTPDEPPTAPPTEADLLEALDNVKQIQGEMKSWNL